MRVRRAVLEASARGRQDFVTAVVEFGGWLEKMEDDADRLDQDTANIQALKDTANRHIWMEREKVILISSFLKRKINLKKKFIF